MSSLPISSKYRSQPDKPVTDAERDDLTRRLNDAFTDGIISVDDYPKLLDGLYAATTLGQLVPLVERLPAKKTYDAPAIVAQSPNAAPGEVVPAASGVQLSRLVLIGSIVVAIIIVITLIAMGL